MAMSRIRILQRLIKSITITRKAHVYWFTKSEFLTSKVRDKQKRKSGGSAILFKWRKGRTGKGPFTKNVRLTPGEGGSAEYGCCYSSVILLFYPDAGGGGLEILVLVLCEWPLEVIVKVSIR